MKKLAVVLISLLSVSYVSAASCTAFTKSLSRFQENSSVLSLQNFLYEKGYLTAKPNGYFGVGTFAGVKAYQQSVGLPQVGNVGPATRAAIRKGTCTTGAQSSQTTNTNVSPVVVTTTTVTGSTSKVDVAIKPPVAVVNTLSGNRNAKRREDLEKILRGMYSHYVDTHGVAPVPISDTPLELCVVPPPALNTATATEVAVLVSPASPCLNYADVTYLSSYINGGIPRDPNLATSSTLTGYTITRGQYYDITLAAKTPEDNAIVKVTCNFNGYCSDLKHISTVKYMKPLYLSSTRLIILRDSSPKNDLVIYGQNFTATNTVTLFSKYIAKPYLLGIFSSTDGASIIIPASSTNQLFSCGDGCVEKLPLGDYTLTISNEGGISNTAYFSFKGFTTSSISTRSDKTVTPKTNSVKVGTFTISAGIPIKMKMITLNATSTSSVLPSKISNFTLKDSVTGLTVGSGGGIISLTNQPLYENQSMIYDLYVDVAEVQTYESGFITYGGYFTVTDTTNNTDLDLPVKDIAFSVSY
jgi:hypothetical protein